MQPTADQTMANNDNQITTTKLSLQALPMEWVIGVSICAGILLVFCVIGVVYLCRRIRTKSANLDNDNPVQFKTIHYPRYSSSDTGDSLHDTGQLLEESVKPKLSISHVQPKLTAASSRYQRNLLSVNHGDVSGTSDEEEAAIQQFANTSGRIWFSIKYEGQSLSITILKARYLRARGMCHEMRDPFVRVYLLPDELNYQQSKSKRRTLSPRFNETFTFEIINGQDVSTRTFKISVYDIDKKNVRHTLGHCIVPLDKIDLTNESTHWRNLDTISQKPNQVGELYFSLCCNPYNDRIKVSILRGKDFNFRRVNITEQAELFIRVEFYYGSKLIKSRDTAKQKLTQNPNIFQNFSFSVVGKYFDSCSITLVAILSMNGREMKCARCTVGSFLYARREELHHWQEMMSNPRTPVERWHFLTEVT